MFSGDQLEGNRVFGAFLSPTATTVTANGGYCLFAFENSGIVDFSLWLQKGNRRVNQATAVMSQKRQVGKRGSSGPIEEVPHMR